jgi:hypothetical protein
MALYGLLGPGPITDEPGSLPGNPKVVLPVSVRPTTGNPIASFGKAVADGAAGGALSGGRAAPTAYRPPRGSKSVTDVAAVHADSTTDKTIDENDTKIERTTSPQLLWLGMYDGVSIISPDIVDS